MAQMHKGEIERRAKALYDVLLGDAQGTESGSIHEIICRHIASAVSAAKIEIQKAERPPFSY